MMTTTENTTVCFTGHRTFSHAALSALPQLLQDTLTELIQSGYDTFRTGGALGFDTMAALKVLELKTKFPHVQLHLYLPCRDQDKLWNADEQHLYEQILARADAIHYTTDTYTKGCMLQRNREMIDGSAICIAYFDGHGGGTAYSYGYANRRGVKVINLAQYIHCEEEE
jgi:uncharacterized phage-like protein YoqJ